MHGLSILTKLTWHKHPKAFGILKWYSIHSVQYILQKEITFNRFWSFKPKIIFQRPWACQFEMWSNWFNWICSGKTINDANHLLLKRIIVWSIKKGTVFHQTKWNVDMFEKSSQQNDPCPNECVLKIFFRIKALTDISNLKNNNLFWEPSAMSTSIRLRFQFWRIYFAEQIQWSGRGFSFSFNFNKLTTRQLVSSCCPQEREFIFFA